MNFTGVNGVVPSGHASISYCAIQMACFNCFIEYCLHEELYTNSEMLLGNRTMQTVNIAHHRLEDLSSIPTIQVRVGDKRL